MQLLAIQCTRKCQLADVSLSFTVAESRGSSSEQDSSMRNGEQCVLLGGQIETVTENNRKNFILITINHSIRLRNPAVKHQIYGCSKYVVIHLYCTKLPPSL